MFGRITIFVYGIVCYASFLAAFLYAVGFLGNFGVPTSLDGASRMSFGNALCIDVALLGVFAAQHSVMARRWFKDAWTRIIPAAAERSTYVLFSSVALGLMFWLWQPIGGTVWHVENMMGKSIILGLYGLGWLIVLAATFLINHFDLFGLRQVWLHLQGRAYTQLRFATPGFYRYVRHPLYVGWLMVMWSSPVMTMAHLVFALAATAYILLAIQFEERDLVRMHPEYAAYRRRVPMLVPSRPEAEPMDSQRQVVGF